jgi:hypothetical protein
LSPAAAVPELSGRQLDFSELLLVSGKPLSRKNLDSANSLSVDRSDLHHIPGGRFDGSPLLCDLKPLVERRMAVSFDCRQRSRH